MAEPAQQYDAPPAAVYNADGQYVQVTPLWMVVLRSVQVFFSFIILIMAAVVLSGGPLGGPGFAVACCVFTWIIVSYVLLTEKLKSWREAYNIWAVLALDLLMAIFWLANMGANAAESTFSNRNATSTSLMGAVAGLSALEWLLVLTTLIFHGHTFRLWHSEHKKSKIVGDNPVFGMNPVNQPVQPTAYGQYSDQQQPQQYPPQPYPTGVAYPPQPQVQPQGYAAFPEPSPYQQQQQPYSPAGTPAPAQPYYPPQQ